MGEFADPQRITITEITILAAMNEDGVIINNFPLNQEHLRHYKIVTPKTLPCPDCNKETETQMYNADVTPQILCCAECGQFVQS